MQANNGPSELRLEENYDLPSIYPAGEVDILTYLLRLVGDQQIHLVFTFEGKLDYERIKQATKLICVKEPILGCQFILDQKRPYWKRRDDLTEINHCSLIQTKNREQTIHDFIIRPSNPAKDLPVQLLLIRQKEKDTLVMKANHTALDGGAMFKYLTELADIYKKIRLNPNYKPKANILGRRGLQQVLEQVPFRKRLFAFLRNRSPKPNWSFPWKGTTNKKPTFQLKRLTEDQFDAIKNFSKNNNVTINDLLFTAYYRAMFKLLEIKNQKESFVSVVTINLRTYLPDNQAESLCNLSTSAYPQLSFQPKETFIETLDRMKQNLDDIKEHYPGIGSAFFIKNLMRLKHTRLQKVFKKRIIKDIETKTTQPVVTNVGLIRAGQFKFGNLQPIDGYMVTPIMNAPGFILGILTFEKRMTISFGYYEDSYDSTVVKRFLDLFEQELDSLQNQ